MSKERNWGLRVSGRLMVTGMTKKQAEDMQKRLSEDVLNVEAVHLKVVG